MAPPRARRVPARIHTESSRPAASVNLKTRRTAAILDAQAAIAKRQ
jgi:hypothetical protein